MGMIETSTDVSNWSRFDQFSTHLHRGGAAAYVWTVGGDNGEVKRSTWCAAGTLGETVRSVLQRAERTRQRVNVYYSVHPARAVGSVYQRSTLLPTVDRTKQLRDQTVHAINCVYAEFDDAETGSRAATLDRINRAPIAPSATVTSGGGVHAYWLLRETLHLDTLDQRALAVALQTLWVAAVGGDDGAHDLPRVLRVPGTRNLKPKYGAEGRAVEWLTCELDRVYDLRELLDTLDSDQLDRDRRTVLRTLATDLHRGLSAAKDPDPDIVTYWRTQYTDEHRAVNAPLEKRTSDSDTPARRPGRPRMKRDEPRELDGWCDRVRAAADNDRNPTLRRAALVCGRLGIDPDLAAAELAAAAATWSDTTHTPARIADVIARGLRDGANSPHQRSARVLTDTDARHVIDITDENLGATSAAIWDGLLSSPYAEHLYRYGDRLLRVDPEQRSTELLDPRGERWRGMIARSCAFVRTSVTGASSECVPPVAMVTDAYVWHSHRVRTVDRIAHTPHLTASGGILSTPGYDAATRTLLLSDIEPLDLTVAQALTWIDELLCDFAFATPADRTNAIALLLLPFVRDLCDCTPLWLIDATRAGTGKTFLIEMLHRVWTGQAPEVRDLPLVPEEQRKALTAALVKQPVAVAFDDVSMVTGHALQRAITSPHWSDRELGSNRELTTTVRCVWLASGNNVTIGSDMVRRTVLIRMVSDLETPSERSDWRRDGDELKTWCTQHRRELVNACLTLAAAGQAYTRPVTARPMASFDAMVRVLTRTLTAAGITKFLDNAATLRTREHDGGAASWRMVFALWYRKYETKPITTAQVLHLVDECESGITVRGETERDRTNAIGKLISRQIETVSTVDGVTVQLVRANESRPPLWRLAVKTSAGSAGSAGLSLRTRAENKNNSPHTMHHGADNYLIISHGNGAVEPAEPAVPAEPATPQTNSSPYRGVYVTLFQARERWYANWNGASMDNRAEPHPDRETAYAYARQCIDAVRGLP